MTNKYKYFVANWKMFGDIRSINSLKKVIKISKLRKYKTAKIIYCPPYTLLNTFVSRLKKTNINVGAQNCHQSLSDGAYTGHVNSQMIKNIGCKYVIIGHSENRIDGDTDSKINKKIKASIENNLNVIFCIGEKIKEKKLKKTKIYVGAQNCHHSPSNGPFTGFINSKMIKNLGCKYVIIGHSESRNSGDTDLLINKKIKSSLKNNLKIFFCIGETIKEKKEKKTKKILSTQIKKGLKKIKNIKNIIIAYEPVWSIGTGLVPKRNELSDNILFIKKFLRKNYNYKSSNVLYGGSVSTNNIRDLCEINQIDGFLVGGASQNSNKFIDIIKKTFN